MYLAIIRTKDVDKEARNFYCRQICKDRFDYHSTNIIKRNCVCYYYVDYKERLRKLLNALKDKGIFLAIPKDEDLE